MIKAIKVTNFRNESLTITLAKPEESGLIIQDIDGIGSPDAEINISDLATTDGGLFTSARAKPRDISITFLPTFHNNIEQARHLIYKYFPVKQPCTLEFITTERDTQITGYVSKMDPDIFTNQETCEVTIKCPDPYFYDASGDKTFVFNGVDPKFTFPFHADLGDLPDRVHYDYTLTSGIATLTKGQEYYITLPVVGDVQFMIDGSGTLYAAWTATISVNAKDGAFDGGSITIRDPQGALVGTTELYSRTTAEDKAFSFYTLTGEEYWSCVSTAPQTLTAGSTYYLVVPGRGTYNFTMPAGQSRTVTSWEISLRIADGVITPNIVNVAELLLEYENGQVAIGQSGTKMFADTVCPVHLAYYQYLPVQNVITLDDSYPYVGHSEADTLFLGEIKQTSEETLTYEGDAETGLLITLQAHGDVGLFTMYDLRTGEYFTIDVGKIATITGTKFSTGDQIIISTQSGNKYVRLLRGGLYTNIINTLDRGSTWFKLVQGDNTFAYMADSGVRNLDFKMSYRTAYQGV